MGVNYDKDHILNKRPVRVTKPDRSKSTKPLHPDSTTHIGDLP